MKVPLKKKSLYLETTQALKIPLMLPALKKKKNEDNNWSLKRMLAIKLLKCLTLAKCLHHRKMIPRSTDLKLFKHLLK